MRLSRQSGTSTSSTRRRLRTVVVVLAAVTTLVIVQAPSGATPAGPIVTTKVVLSSPRTDCPSGSTVAADANAPQIAIEPGHPSQLSAIYTRGNTGAEMSALSTDKGDSWTATWVPGLTRCTGGAFGGPVDNFLAVGSEGRAILSSSWVTKSQDPATDHDAAHIYVSAANDGLTYGAPVDPTPTAGSQRGPVVFDPGSNDAFTVAFDDLHYVNYADSGLYGETRSVSVVRSVDGGQHFDRLGLAVSSPSGEQVNTIGLTRSGSALVLVVAEFNESDLPAFLNQIAPLPEHLFAVTSFDNGLHWTAPGKSLGTYLYNYPGKDSPLLPTDGCCIPDVAGTPNGDVYVTWVNGGDAVIKKSSDAGATWRDVNGFKSPTGHMLEAAMGIDGNGALGVFYYAKTGASIVQPMIATSKDSGSTWRQAALIDAFDVTKVSTTNADAAPMGPYQDIVGLDKGFGAVATVGQNRVGSGSSDKLPSDIWFFRVLP